MRASPALLRARAPYIVKNAITGTAVCALVISICKLQILTRVVQGLTDSDAYTIKAISQDEFEDVVVPDEPIKRPQAASTTESVQQAVASRKS
jgi:cytochrome c oxidase assembly factor 3